MANRLDVVAVGVEHERPIIIRMIMRPQARRAIVLAAGGDRCAVERIDCRAVIRRNRDMYDALEAAFAADPEVRLAVATEADCGASALRLGKLHDQAVAERGQRLLVEGLGSRVV